MRTVSPAAIARSAVPGPIAATLTSSGSGPAVAALAAPLGLVTTNQSPRCSLASAARSAVPPSAGSVMAITGALTTSAPAAARLSARGLACSRGLHTTILNPPSGFGA